MNEKKDFSKIWITLLSIVAILFLIAGIAMIIFDNAMINGIQYIITSVIFGGTAFFTKQNKFRPNFLNPLLSLGFVLVIIGLAGNPGLSMHIGIWVLGIILFLWEIFTNEE